MKTTSPAFQFYPKDYLTSEHVARMSLDEQGAYVRLLCHAWLEGSIPSNKKDIARMLGVSAQKLTAMWPSISRCFGPDPEDPNRLLSPRLQREVEKQEAYAKRASKGGKAAAKKRAKKRAKNGASTSQAPLKSNTSSPSPSSSPNKSVIKDNGGKPPTDKSEKKEERWNTRIAPLVREHLWRGKSPPSKAPSARWSMGDELKICRELLKQDGWDVDRVERVIVGFANLRDRGGFPDVQIGEPATLRRALFDQPWGATRTVAICEAEFYRMESTRKPEGKPGRVRIDISGR